MSAFRLPVARRRELAAVIDGEGWVSTRRWVVEIGNTCLPWLRGLREMVGGVGSLREETRRRPGWKRFWRWRVYGADACVMLARCLPHLVVKRRRAARFVHRYLGARNLTLTG